MSRSTARGYEVGRLQTAHVTPRSVTHPRLASKFSDRPQTAVGAAIEGGEIIPGMTQVEKFNARQRARGLKTDGTCYGQELTQAEKDAAAYVRLGKRFT